MNSNTILLVQSEHDSHPRLRSLLEYRGYTVVQALDAATAMDIANRSEIALVVTELYLPLGTCRCVARVIARSPALRRTKLLAYTAHGKRKDRDWAQRIGADGYVITRSGEERVLSVVDRLMKARSAPRRYGNRRRPGGRRPRTRS